MLRTPDIMETLVSLICVALAGYIFLPEPTVAQGTNTTLPLSYQGQISEGDGSQTCTSMEQERVRNEVKNATRTLIRESVVPLLQANQTQPPTGYSCGGSTGWRRLAYLNMSDPSQQCPSVWQEITTPHRVCGRTSSSGGCQGLNYTTSSEPYSQVCGRMTGYQIGFPNAFNADGETIDTNYVNGISVTRGSPRQHIWTFAAGVDEQSAANRCPCIIGSTAGSRVPSFVAQNYFCESGLTQAMSGPVTFWPNGDPLWDGQGCGPTSTCCTFNLPPWFNIQLSLPTTDNIEVRICNNSGFQASDSPIQLMELYVK